MTASDAVLARNGRALNKKRFLVCGIRGAERRDISSFFVSKDDESPRFCEALVAGEGEAKAILSTFEIDEIIVIGSAALLGEKGESVPGEKMALDEGIDLMCADLRSLSDFDFFRYRMTQFAAGVQIDLADSLEALDPARRERLMAFSHSLFGDELSCALPTLFSSKDLREKFTRSADGLSLEELDWLFRYLFCEMGASSRMRPQAKNMAVPISFVPISTSFGFEDVSLFHDLIASLVQEPDVEAELYVDLHGLPSEASAVCASTLYSLSDDPNARIHIVATTSVHRGDVAGFQQVDMQQRHYRIDKLMAGIRAFLNNGKTDILRSYWDEAKLFNPVLKNEYVDQILMAMGYVDAGISLCNIDELTMGILALRRLLNHPEDAPKPSQEEDAFVIMMVRESVLGDYGKLMDESSEALDPFDLVKWGFNKKFFQQVITIIESLMPAQLISRGILYPAASEEEVLAYKKAVSLHYWDSLPAQRWMFKDIDHYFIKFYGRFAVDYRSRAVPPNTQYVRVREASVFGDPLEKPGVLPAHSLIADEDLFVELFQRYYDLGSFRNTVNHAEKYDEASVELLAISPVWQQAEKLIGGFIECYERVLAALDGKVPEDLVPLSSVEFKDYFFEHGPKNDPNYNVDVAGFTPSNRARPRGARMGARPAAGPRVESPDGASAGNDKSSAQSGKAAGGRGGGAHRGRGGRGGAHGNKPVSSTVSAPVASGGESVTVSVTMPKSVLDDLRSDKSKKGEVVVRLSFE